MSRSILHRDSLPAALLVGGLICLGPTKPLAEEASIEGPTVGPIPIDFTEKAERTLLLLDVEGIDADGRLLPGLRKEDFRIRVNYNWREIYSVDDLCPCGDAAEDASPAPTDPGEAARIALTRAPPHFVLYFDYSQLGTAGRAHAVQEARRWAEEVMEPEDRVMVVAYANDAGLHTLSDFTSDPRTVLAAIERASVMPELDDPFPTRLAERLEMCASGTLSCSHTGRNEYKHARRSMETLRNFLTDLDRVSVRKTLLLFHENASIFPGRMYGVGPGYITQPVYAGPGSRGWVPDLIELEEELGGAATASRTVVYPILCGSVGEWSVNLGANLADQTGGDYNSRLEDLRQVLDGAGRRCPCFYRIGLDMSHKEKSFVLRTKIKVRGEKLPSRYRVEYLTDRDRWMRKAQLVMTHPEAWNDLQVRAVVVPERASKKSWDVTVAIVADISQIQPSPTGEHEGEWEVAAAFGTDGFRKAREMVGVYRARAGDRAQADGIALHERRIEGLRPGRYELRAFIRDRETDRFGGTRFELELPEIVEGALSAPLMLRPDAWHFRSVLPLLEEEEEEPTEEARPRQLGGLPSGSTIVAGDPIQFRAWHCAADPSTLRSSLRRESSIEISEPSLRELERSGRCALVAADVDTTELPHGEYVYELTTVADLRSEASFRVVAPERP